MSAWPRHLAVWHVQTAQRHITHAPRAANAPATAASPGCWRPCPAGPASQPPLGRRQGLGAPSGEPVAAGGSAGVHQHKRDRPGPARLPRSASRAATPACGHSAAAAGLCKRLEQCETQQCCWGLRCVTAAPVSLKNQPIDMIVLLGVVLVEYLASAARVAAQNAQRWPAVQKTATRG